MRFFVVNYHNFHIIIYNINNNVNQNTNQNINQLSNQNTIIINNQPVIEKVKYIEKYRTVYVDRPQPKRYARRLSAPICLLQSLWVYCEDLGDYKNHRDANEVIRMLNERGAYGRNDWRIPTSSELSLMENYADAVGLGDDIYLAIDHSNGVLRPVSTGPSIAEQEAEQDRQRQLQAMADAEKRRKQLAAEQERQRQLAEDRRVREQKLYEQRQLIASGQVVLSGNTLWQHQNIGATSLYSKGDEMSNGSYRAPLGWRLPTIEELLRFVKKAQYKRTVAPGGYLASYYTLDGVVLPSGVYLTMDGPYDISRCTKVSAQGVVRLVKSAIVE